MQPETILNNAACHEVGTAVTTEDPKKLRGKLYAARHKAQNKGNHAFDEMSFFEMPDGRTLYIVNHSALRTWNERAELSEEGHPS